MSTFFVVSMHKNALLCRHPLPVSISNVNNVQKVTFNIYNVLII